MFTKVLKDQGFQEVLQEPYMVSKEDIFYFFFIDDIVFVFKKKDQPNIKEIVNTLKEKFKLEELGEFKWFLRIYIFKDKDKQLL